jgi:hypothetical protein
MPIPTQSTQPAADPMELTHEQTLDWIRQQRAWFRTRKTKPIWARPVSPDEIGKEFQTADRAIEQAKEGYWLCVGVAEEPWFQRLEKIEGKYEPAEEVEKRFEFDSRPSTYRVYKPKGDVFNWAAQVRGRFQGREIDGFTIRPNYDMDHPLHSDAGGYVVMDDASDPYQAKPTDVWLVQQNLFESTYEPAP